IKQDPDYRIECVRVFLEIFIDCAYGDPGRLIQREAVYARRDGWKSNYPDIILPGNFQRFLITAGKKRFLITISPIPHWPDGMDYILHRQVVTACNFCVACFTATERLSFLEQSVRRRPVHCAVDTASTEEARIRSIDNRICITRFSYIAKSCIKNFNSPFLFQKNNQEIRLLKPLFYRTTTRNLENESPGYIHKCLSIIMERLDFSYTLFSFSAIMYTGLLNTL